MSASQRNKQSLGLALALLALSPSAPQRKKRRVWVKKWLEERRAVSDTALLRTLELEDYRNFLRMDEDSFRELLALVSPAIQRGNTHMRDCISPEERVVTTLRFLATGRAYNCLKFSSGVSRPSIVTIIPETCRAIWKALRECVKLPSTSDKWKATAKDFELKWDFTHCIGAIDGKHVAIQIPHASGSMFYNYKGFFGVVLMAVVNAKYEFLYVNTGVNGSASDSAVCKTTSFYRKLSDGSLDLPDPEPLLNSATDISVPYVFLGDAAFPISENLMKPYSTKAAARDREKRIYNYRLSRARRVVENAFGILAMRFRVLLTTIGLKELSAVDDVVLACIALHNYLISKSTGYLSPSDVGYEDTAGAVTDGSWRENGNNHDLIGRAIKPARNSRQRDSRRIYEVLLKREACRISRPNG